eukprot:3864476-Amphidinium_carterae.2
MSTRAQIEAASRAHSDQSFREQFWQLSCIRRAAATSQVNARLGKALAARPRSDTSTEPIETAPGLTPGSQCFIFHHPSPRRRTKRWWSERWVGPGLVVATERQAAWVIYRRRLMKVAKTHIRPSTELERVNWGTLADLCFGRAGTQNDSNAWHHPSASDVHRAGAEDHDPFHLDEFLKFAGDEVGGDDENPDAPPKRKRGRPRKYPPPPPPVVVPGQGLARSSHEVAPQDNGPNIPEVVIPQTADAPAGEQNEGPPVVPQIPEDPLDLLEPPGTYWDMSIAPRFQQGTDEVPDELAPGFGPTSRNVLTDGKPSHRISTKTRFSPYVAFLDSHGHELDEEERVHDACVLCYLVGKARSQELTWKTMTLQQRSLFRPALVLEWKTWTDFQAWRHPTDEESVAIVQGRLQVIPTRWVLILKTITTTMQKPKARLVAQGCFDSELLGGVYSPVASSSVFFLLLSFGLQPGWEIAFYDATSAYLQSDGRQVALRLPESPPPPGFNSGQIVIAQKAIYGLRDSAKSWYVHLQSILVSDSWVESAWEPGVFFRHSDSQLCAIIFVYVDDFTLIYDKRRREIASQLQKTMQKLCARAGEPDPVRGHKFLGRYVKVEIGGLRVSQIVKVDVPEVSATRRKQRDSVLSTDELSSFRSMIGALLWSGRCVIPQLLLDVSRYAQLVTKATIDDYLGLISLAMKWKGWVGEIFIPSTVGKCLASKQVSLYVMSDASFADQPGLRSQDGSILALGPPDCVQEFTSHNFERFATAGWLCATVKRVVRSTLAAECYGHSEGLESAMLLRCLLLEALSGVQVADSSSGCIDDLSVVIHTFTDNKGLFDALSRETSTGVGSTSRDKRASIALCAIRDLYMSPGECLRIHWIPTTHMVADRLTKSRVNDESLKKLLAARS